MNIADLICLSFPYILYIIMTDFHSMGVGHFLIKYVFNKKKDD